MRCVLYLRVSTDEQSTSIADQRRTLTDYAQKHGYTIVREFVDEGISGDATEKRIAFQEMIAASSRKQWELVLAWDQDRFGRFDALEAGYWIKPMRDAGIALETVGQGRIDWSDFSSRIVWSINQEAKHGFLKDLARASLRGSIARAKEGKANGRNPYGYVKGPDGRYVFDDAEKVEAVRRVFELRLQGNGYRLIALAMNDSGIASPGGGKWSHDSVRLILARAEVYAGTAFYGRRNRGKYVTSQAGNVGTTGGNQRENPEPIRVDNAHPGIISADTCRRARELQHPKRKPRALPGSAFAGLLTCGRCGETMYFRTHHRGYLCGRYVRGHGCGYCFIGEETIQQAIADLIVELCGGSMQALTASIQRKLDSRTQPDIEKMRGALAAIDSRISKAMDRILIVNARLVPELERKILEMRDQRKRIEEQIHDAGQSQAQESAEQIAARLWSLGELIKTAKPAIVRSRLSQIFSAIRIEFEPDGETKRGKRFACKGLVADIIGGGEMRVMF